MHPKVKTHATFSHNFYAKTKSYEKGKTPQLKTQPLLQDFMKMHPKLKTHATFSHNFYAKTKSYEKGKTPQLKTEPLLQDSMHSFQSFSAKSFCGTILFQNSYKATNNNLILKFVFTLHF